jgi:diacylglycerol O-acyltransferase
MERLRAQDLMMVWPEDRGWAQDIGALVILESQGQFSIEDARHLVGGRLGRLPRFGQLLHQPGLGRGWPLWVDASSVDLHEHVQELPLDANAGEAELLRTCEELRLRPLDRARPLWKMWFVTGPTDGRVALFVKVHHAMADGVAGIGALGTFFDFTPETHESEAPPSLPAPIPSERDLLRDNLRGQLHRAAELARHIAHPAETAKAMRAGWPAVRESFVEGRAPRTSLNDGPIGWHRRFGLVRADLDALKATAHSNGAKVNDVLMTVVAAGLRDLLLHRGEAVEGVVLRAFVPVSLHATGADDAQGNLDGAMIIPLPVGVRDDIARLRLITAETAERKKRSRPQGGTLFRNRPIQKLFLRLAPYQRVMNTYVANVPGPPVPLYFAGMRVQEVFPVVPLMGNVSVGVGALSYASQLNLTAVVDRGRCPDVDVFVDGLRGSLDRLGAVRQAAA